jgi:multicomponent Na+:H+ antiporter subunit B
MTDSQIVEIISRKLIPFVVLFGLYMISYGHISPGGGFQGGVVLASGAILLFLSRGKESAFSFMAAHRVRWLVTGAFFLFLAMGFAGIAFYVGFLGDFLPIGVPGDIPSVGLKIFLNMAIGLNVGAGIVLICFYLFREV